MKKRILTLIILILAFVGIVFSEQFPDIIVTSPDGIWTDTRAYATLQDAITAIGANNREIVIVRYEPCAALTIPANISLRFLGSGSISNTGQLTINTQYIKAGNHQIFTGTGDIDFTYGASVESIWFEDLHAAFTLTNDDRVELIINSGWGAAVDTNCAVGDYVVLKWKNPRHRIVVNTGVELSNIKLIEAGNYQLFGGPGDFDFLDGTRLKLVWFARLRSVLNWVEDEEVTIVVSGTNTVSYTQASTLNESFDFQSEQGQFSIDGGITLTLNSPANIIAQPNHQIFSGLGNILFTDGGTVYVGWFGLDGASDEDAVNKAITAVFSGGGGTVKISKDALTTDGTIIVPSYITLKGNNTLITSSATQVIKFYDTVTHASDICLNANLRGIRLKKAAQTWDDGTDTTTTGIWAYQTRHCNIEVDVTNFNLGLLVDGGVTGAVENEFYLREIYDCRVGVQATSSGIGWANANNFWGGHVAYTGASVATAFGNGIEVQNINVSNGGTEASIGNVFHGTVLEQGSNAYAGAPVLNSAVIYTDGQSNIWQNVYIEVSAVDKSQTIYFDTAGAYYNRVIVTGGTVSVGYESYVTDDGYNNFVSLPTEQSNASSHLIRNEGPILIKRDRANPAFWPAQADANLVLWDAYTPYADAARVKRGATGSTTNFVLSNLGKMAVGHSELDSSDQFGPQFSVKARAMEGSYTDAFFGIVTGNTRTTTAAIASIGIEDKVILAAGAMTVNILITGVNHTNNRFYSTNIIGTVADGVVVNQTKVYEHKQNCASVVSAGCILAVGGDQFSINVESGYVEDWYWSVTVQYQGINTDG